MSLSPGYGPKDGGTHITVSGTQLDAGQYQFVLVNNVPCRNVRSVLSPYHSGGAGCLSVSLRMSLLSAFIIVRS